MKMKIVGDSHPTSWERLSRKTGRASRAEDRNSHDRARIEPQRELPKAPRRFTPARKCWISRFEKRDPADYTGIRRKNRPKQFQIENDSRKRDTIPRRTRRKPSFPSSGSRMVQEIPPRGESSHIRILEPGVGVEPTSATFSGVFTAGCYESILQPAA